MSLQGKAAFITGAGGFLGSGCARKLAALGAKVALCDLNEKTVEKVAREIRAAGGKAWTYTADVTESVSIDMAIEAAAEVMCGLDILIHAAGGSARSKMKPLIQQKDEVILQVLKVNLLGALYTSRAAGRIMVAQGKGGRILNFASTVGVNGLRGCVEYAAAKGGIMAMTKSLAKELAPYQITVNCVAPGIVQRPGEDNEAVKTNFLGRKCTDADVAALVAFMVSEESGFITGQTYIIDGGRSLAMKGSD